MVQLPNFLPCQLRLIAQKLVNAETEKSGKPRKQGDIGIGSAGFPFGNGGLGNTHVLRQFFLGNATFPAVFGNDPAKAKAFFVHKTHLPPFHIEE